MRKAKNILAIDTALNGCGVAYAGIQGAAAETLNMQHGQAEYLVPMIERVLKSSGCCYQDIDAIITTMGPGAFTGLRIGFSTAKALSLSLNIQMFGITTLQAIALDYSLKTTAGAAFVVLLDTKRGDFYAQKFAFNGHVIEPACLVSQQDVSHYADGAVIVGDGALKDFSVCSGFERPSPDLMINHFYDHPEFFRDDPAPFYLREADVSQSKKAQRVLGT